MPTKEIQDLPSSPEIIDRTVQVIAEWQNEPGALIPVLQRLQQTFGFLPEEALRTVSREMSIPYSEVTGVVSFYSYFTTVPRGLHTVRVCLGTACYVRGGKEVLESIKSELGIDVGQTTEDRRFTLEIGRCFGACGLAPVVMIDDTVHQRVGPACVSRIIAQYRNDGEVDGEDDGEEVGNE
jgi:NADH:ubiquinone oxidoreductase subunit E